MFKNVDRHFVIEEYCALMAIVISLGEPSTKHWHTYVSLV